MLPVRGCHAEEFNTPAARWAERAGSGRLGRRGAAAICAAAPVADVAPLSSPGLVKSRSWSLKPVRTAPPRGVGLCAAHDARRPQPDERVNGCACPQHGTARVSGDAPTKLGRDGSSARWASNSGVVRRWLPCRAARSACVDDLLMSSRRSRNRSRSSCDAVEMRSISSCQAAGRCVAWRGPLAGRPVVLNRS